MKDQAFYGLALTLVPGLGVSRLHQLLRRCGSALEVFKLSRAELRQSFQLAHEVQAFIAGGATTSQEAPRL